MKEIKRITIGYCRVSTTAQAEDQNALKQQRSRLETEIQVDEIICEVGSGTNPERPEFQKMIARIEEGEVETLYATRLDRLARDSVSYYLLKKVIQKSNTNLTLLDGGKVDFETPSGNLVANISADFAIYEVEMLKHRQKKGFNYRRSRKVAWTRPPFGYVIEHDQYVLDSRPIVCLLAERPEHYPISQKELDSQPDKYPEVRGISRSDIAVDAINYFRHIRRTRPVLRYLAEKYGVRRKDFALKKKRNSIQNLDSDQHSESNEQELHRVQTNPVLTDELLFWKSGQNFKDWLNNPVLRGHTAYKKSENRRRKSPKDWEWHYNTHPDQILLTDEEFQDFQDILKNNTRKVGVRDGDYNFHFTGLVVCAQCGNKCVLKRSPAYSYYGCRHANVSCNNSKNVRLEMLDRAVIQEVFLAAQSLVREEPEIVPEEDQEPLEVIHLRKQLEGINQLLDQGGDDILKGTKQKLEQKIERLLSPPEEDKFVNVTAEEILSHPHATHLGFWYALNLKEREIIYEKLINQIKISDGAVSSITLHI